MATATRKHLHIKRRILREVIVFEAELHITPLRASDFLQEPVFFFLLLSALVSQLRRFQMMINA